MSFLRDRRNKAAFERVKRRAGDEEVVCGYTDDEGTPHYFLAAKDASESDLRARAFEMKHGRPMNRAESLLDAAANGEYVKAYEMAMAKYLNPPELVEEDI